MKAEEFIKDCTRTCSNELCAVEDRCGKEVISYYAWLTPEQALRAVELAKKEMLDKAGEWIVGNADKYIVEETRYNQETHEYEDWLICHTDILLQDFLEAMKE